MAASQEDLARLLVSVELSQAKVEKQAAAIARAAEKSAKQTETAYQAANSNVASGFARTGAAVTTSLRNQQYAAKNLGFQLNDIGTQLASGTSPFRVLAQQGGQVVQILNETGNPIRAIGSAFGGLLNPIGLVTIGIGVLAAAAYEYYSGAEDGHEKAAKAIDKELSSLKALIDAYGNGLNPELETQLEIRKALLEVAKEEAARAQEIETQYGKATEVLRGVYDQLAQFGAQSMDAADPSAFKGYFDALTNLEAKLGNNTASAKDVEAALEALRNTGISGAAELATSLQNKLLPVFKDIELAANASGKAIFDAINSMVPFTTLPSLSTVGGSWLNPEQLDAVRQRFSGITEELKTASELIKKFEGFTPTAKWDVNHFRVGFGSDSFVDSMMKVQEVTKETTVTFEQAEQDLALRIREFQSTIMDQIGPEIWKSFSENQQAALTSIAYNYGRLPQQIVEAIKQGGGPEVVAKAISSLSANPGRRKEEAQTFLSGTGISMKEAGLASSTKKTPTQIFQGDMDQIQRRIDLMNAEYSAQAKLNPLVEDYGFKVEQARIKQELLNEAKKAGVEITPQLAEKIDQLATNYAKASSGADQLRDSQQRALEAAQQVASIGKDAVGGLIRDLMHGKDASEALANALSKVADQLLNMALDGLFGGGSSKGLGLIGSLFGFANGGIAANGRPQSLKTFARGGTSSSAAIFGEAGPEAAVPLPDGRSIPVTLSAPNVGRGTGSNDVVRLVLQDDSGRMAEVADQQIRTHSGTIVQVAVQQSTKTVQRQFPGMMANAQSRTG